ncbi:MAG: hypothetical protein Q9220_007003 [cf. Caloplaca sp. 1 TL-2023]
MPALDSPTSNRSCSPRRLRWIVATAVVLIVTLIALSVDRTHHAAWTNAISRFGSGSRDPNRPPPIPPPDNEEYVAICMAVRDQHRELPELLQHHYHHLGVRRFYIMDDGSQPPLSGKDYGIPASVLTFDYFYPHEHVQSMQYHIYNECNTRYGSRHKWIGYLDADEYLEMTGNQTLVEFLQMFEHNEKIGAVGVNWKTHTSGGLLKRPPEGCRKAFTECIIDDPKQDNKHIKSFVKPQYYSEPRSPHSFVLKDDTITVGENGDKVVGAYRVPITRDKWSLHHYGIKSMEQYVEKEHRGNAMDQPKDMGWWDHIKALEHVECKEMARYTP